MRYNSRPAPPAAGVTTLAALTDVSITGAANFDMLYFDYASSKWVNSPVTLASGLIQDVAISDGTDGDILRYDGSDEIFKNGPIVGLQNQEAIVHIRSTSGWETFGNANLANRAGLVQITHNIAGNWNVGCRSIGQTINGVFTIAIGVPYYFWIMFDGSGNAEFISNNTTGTWTIYTTGLGPSQP